MKFIYFFLFPIIAFCQPPNCNVYLYNKDTTQYLACKSVEDVRFYQYTRQYQEQFDKALEICPYFAYAYSAKSTAYLKSGDFLTWKYLIDKAVLYDKSYLDYRAWCRYQFFRDYKGAIEDIEALEVRHKTINIGYSAGGEYHLLVAKAMCYSALMDKQKAIAILEKLFVDPAYTIGLYDYYQLAVTYFQVGDLKQAEKYFLKQSEENELAENKFYLAKIAKINNNTEKYNSIKQEAIQLYKGGKNMFDPYTEHQNKVYLSSIINE